MMMDTTDAKIGRSERATSTILIRCGRPDQPVRRRAQERFPAGPTSRPVHDHAIALIQARVDEPLVPFPVGRGDVSNVDFLVLVHHIDERTLGTLQHGALRNENRIRLRIAGESHLHKLPRQEAMLRVGERDSGLT
jgi:hypothetical protein